MKKLTILFDADDTVENLSDCWIAMLNERYGTSVTPEDVHGWDISLAFPTLTKEPGIRRYSMMTSFGGVSLRSPALLRYSKSSMTRGTSSIW